MGQSRARVSHAGGGRGTKALGSQRAAELHAQTYVSPQAGAQTTGCILPLQPPENPTQQSVHFRTHLTIHSPIAEISKHGAGPPFIKRTQKRWSHCRLGLWLDALRGILLGVVPFPIPFPISFPFPISISIAPCYHHLVRVFPAAQIPLPFWHRCSRSDITPCSGRIRRLLSYIRAQSATANLWPGSYHCRHWRHPCFRIRCLPCRARRWQLLLDSQAQTAACGA